MLSYFPNMLGALKMRLWSGSSLLVLAVGAAACDVPRKASARPQDSSARVSPSAETKAPSLRTREPCTDEMVLVGSFCIDRFEAHLVSAAEPKQPHSPFRRPEAGVQYEARSAPDVFPQGYISRDEAASACRAAGKRLCSAREWQTACKGRAGYKYPYGRDEVPGRCNTRKRHAPQRLFADTVKRYGEPHLNDTRLNQLSGTLAKTGEHADCVSDYGVFDMMGNLHEWVSDDVNSALPKKIPIPNGVQAMGKRNNGVFMGGYYSSKREHGRGCEYVTTHHAPRYHDYSTGFRCCSEPAASSEN